MPTHPSRRWLSGALSAAILVAACDNATAPVFQGVPPVPLGQSVVPGVDLFLEFEGAFGSNFGAAMALIEQAHGATAATP